jgi:hypothetical protein
MKKPALIALLILAGAAASAAQVPNVNPPNLSVPQAVTPPQAQAAKQPAQAAQQPARARRCYDEKQQVTSYLSFLLARCGNVGDPDSTYEYAEQYKESTGAQSDGSNITWKQYDITARWAKIYTSIRIYYPPNGRKMGAPKPEQAQHWLDNEKTRINLDEWKVSQVYTYNLYGNPSLPTVSVILYQVTKPGNAGGNGHYGFPTEVSIKQWRVTTDLVNGVSYDIIYDGWERPCPGDQTGTNCEFVDNLGRVTISTQ